MPIYILLSRLSQQGVATLQANPTRLLEVNRDVEELGARVLHQWATLGEFDFVNVIEAPDTATVARVSIARRPWLDEDRDAAGADDRRVRRDASVSGPRSGPFRLQSGRNRAVLSAPAHQPVRG